jgi:hypothetical protein
MADILVKINADAKQFKDEIDAVSKKSEDLRDSLEGVGKAAGLTFAALVGAAGLSLKAFGDAQKSTQELTVALENQGKSAGKLVTQYKGYADAVSKATGIDDDAIVSAQAKLQALIGQNEITPELTQAVVDLSTQTGSLDSAAQKLGLAFQGNIGFFNKQKIAIDDNASANERLNQAIAGVQLRFGGLAAAQASGVNSIKKLDVAFENLLEDVGEKLAPAFEVAVKALTQFVQLLDTPEVLEYVVAIGKVVAVFAGAITAIVGAGLALIKLKEGIEIANIAIKALGLTARGALLASGVGALLVIATLIFEHWSDIWPRISAVFKGAVVTITEAAGGVGKILKGIFTRDFKEITDGVEQVRGSLAKGFEAGSVKFQQETEHISPLDGLAPEEDGDDAILAKKKALAEKAAAEQARQDALRLEASRNTQNIALLQTQQGSEDLIKAKQAENATIQQLETEKNKVVIEALNERLKQQEEIELQARLNAAAEEEQFKEQTLANNEAFQALTLDEQRAFLIQYGQQLKSSQDTEREAKSKFVAAELKEQIDKHNKFLAEEQKYGILYALINEALHSNEVEGFKKGTGELVQLTNSKYQALKEIGKAAAISQIVIKTAESAMNIYSGFSAIPIIGPVLGIAGATAAIIYGAEQIDNVTSAADGGLLTGGIPGRDSVPMLGMPGELVVPTRNFEEVVGATRAARSGESPAAGGELHSEAIVGHLADISAKLNQPPSTNLNIQGDFIGDDQNVDRMIRKINDAVIYRNAQVLTRPGGVTG